MWFGYFFLYLLLFLPHAASISCMSRIPRNNKKETISFNLVVQLSLPCFTHSPLALSCALFLALTLSLSHIWLACAAALINSMPRNGRVSNELLMNCFLACALFMLLPDWKIVIYTHTHICLCIYVIYIYLFFDIHTHTHVCVRVFLLYDSACLTHNLVVQKSPCNSPSPLLSLPPPSLSLSHFPYFSLCNMCITYSMNWNRACIRPRWASRKWNIMKAGHNYQK